MRRSLAGRVELTGSDARSPPDVQVERDGLEPLAVTSREECAAAMDGGASGAIAWLELQPDYVRSWSWTLPGPATMG